MLCNPHTKWNFRVDTKYRLTRSPNQRRTHGTPSSMARIERFYCSDLTRSSEAHDKISQAHEYSTWALGSVSWSPSRTRADSSRLPQSTIASVHAPSVQLHTPHWPWPVRLYHARTRTVRSRWSTMHPCCPLYYLLVWQPTCVVLPPGFMKSSLPTCLILRQHVWQPHLLTDYVRLLSLFSLCKYPAFPPLKAEPNSPRRSSANFFLQLFLFFD